MKKILMGACALLALAAASCNNCGEGSCEATANDSLSIAYGDYVGSMLHGEFARYTQGTQEDKQDFVRGLQLVFGADADKNERMGIQVALQLLSEIDQLESQGVKFDKGATVNAFKKAFLSDSIDFMEASMRQNKFRDLLTKAQQEAKEAKEAEKATADDAVANGKAAEEFVAKLKAESENVQTLPSGLVYVVEAEGEGNKPAETATVVVNYVGKHLNGEIFDQTEGEPAEFNLQGVVQGFREGLMQIAKGGKATLYLPGELAYGANGAPGAGIGPNEMLIFEVELLDIK